MAVAAKTPTKSAMPTFRDPKDMSSAELSDPDYRLKQLKRHFGGIEKPTCSKCHHCRR